MQLDFSPNSYAGKMGTRSGVFYTSEDFIAFLSRIDYAHCFKIDECHIPCVFKQPMPAAGFTKCQEENQVIHPVRCAVQFMHFICH